MEKKSTLNKKLKSYSALAGTLIAAGSTSSNAQVIYTDVTPDATVTTGNAYNLDMDNDGTVDFQIAIAHATYTSSSGGFTLQYDYGLIAPSDPTSAVDTTTIAVGSTYTTFGAKGHNLNDPIASTNAWEDGAASAYQLLGIAFGAPYSALNYGDFLGVTDKYIGLRFQIAGADHYGWVRLDVNSTMTSFTVKDYAYDGTAGTTILCGAMPTGIANELSHNVAIYSADQNIFVNMNNAGIAGTVVVTDVLGKTVATAEVSNANVVIPMSEAQTGIYFVTVNQGDARFTKKVIIN